MKLAILGTRGIPNNHGGFEQFAEYLSQHLVSNGHEVYVYNSHSHPYKKKIWNGVTLIHKYDPENQIGTAGQFLYDLNCVLDSRKREFDVILQLGYTSSSIWGWLLPAKTVIITNMDGLEWKRSKYSKSVKRFLKFAEKLAVRKSDYLVSDSLGIKSYLKRKYNVDSKYIAYGAELFFETSEKYLELYTVEKYNYDILIARLEPENNIETILDGVVKLGNETPFLVIGKHETNFGEYLKKKYRKVENIRFLGGIYNIEHLNNLRYFSNLYFHGHSVGGTNPSLLEAMASNALIVAHNNIFNKSILAENALYFVNSDDVKKQLSIDRREHLKKIENNREEITVKFKWSLINSHYEEFILKSIKS